VSGFDVEREVYRIGGYVVSLGAMESKRKPRRGNPAVWLLSVASVAEVIRSSALEAFDQYRAACPGLSMDAGTLGLDVINQVRDAVLEALGASGGGGAE
jgi:hypothetical protein